MFIPALVLKQLYTFNSLRNYDGGVQFSLKNRLSDATLTGITSLSLAGINIPLSKILLDLGEGNLVAAANLTESTAIPFSLKDIVTVRCIIPNLPVGKHPIELVFQAKPFGKLTLKIEDSIQANSDEMVRIPRDSKDDFSEEAIKKRHEFLKEKTGVAVQHIDKYSFDPHITAGNCEHFVGVAQVPIGLAGPLTVNGEHAQGDFIIPLATAEGTLVASYNRGIKVLNLCGGVKCTVVDDAMQRAPVFVFEDARGARAFVKWVLDNFAKIAEEAEATTKSGKLSYIDPYLASHFAYLRFNFTTGDAAGQNMVGRATFAACSWILDAYKEHKIEHFFLESNLATDKKASQVNVMHTRGKRVTAECVLKRDVLLQHMRVEPKELAYHAGIANVGAILSGANNNGLHSANGITAMFIATGQDVANVAESSAGIIYIHLREDGDLYISITIPSLIVATYGGGTGLATQRECLEILGCYGTGKVMKFAEIIAGVVLAGEISLASAISSSDWVSSHEQYGRNR